MLQGEDRATEGQREHARVCVFVCVRAHTRVVLDVVTRNGVTENTARETCEDSQAGSRERAKRSVRTACYRPSGAGGRGETAGKRRADH